MEQDLVKALKGIVKVLDGSQPIDDKGALFIAQYALKELTSSEKVRRKDN